MSLLSALIAELTSLIEGSRDTQTMINDADERLEHAATTAHGATVGSSSLLPAEALAQLQSSRALLEEAQRLLNAGSGRWQSYIAVLSGGAGAGGAPQARPPLSATGATEQAARKIPGPAAHGIRPPTPSRHLLARIGRSTRLANKNTVILPGVDVDADLEAIRTGRAHWNTDTNRYEINGRTWGVEENGTVFPASGPGLAELTRSQLKALRALNIAEQPIGIWPKSHRKEPSITQSDWDRAAEIYRRHPRHNQGAP